jgi:uncharacterized iron-regulated membrane protein
VKGIRTTLFWVHLTAGIVAGTVIFVMSVTGTLLACQQSVLRMIESSQRTVAVPPVGARLEFDEMLARLRAAVPGAQPATVTFESAPDAAVMVALSDQTIAFVNPYTGELLGRGSARARGVYRSLTNWHRYLALEGAQRPTGRAITGACNAAFLLLAISGLYLWWPKQWTWRHLRPVVWFRGGLSGRARDFNWHNAIGLWCAPVIVILTATGMVISYTWASNLVYTLTGSPVPSAPGRGAGPAGGAERGAPARAAEAPRTEPRTASLEQAFLAGAAQVPTWRTMIVRLPARGAGPVSLSISDREHWNAFARSTLTIDSATGERVRWDPYERSTLGQKTRGWMRFAHTGELGGVPGEVIAGLASAGGGFLVFTGVSLSLRRFAGWRARRQSREMEKAA